MSRTLHQVFWLDKNTHQACSSGIIEDLGDLMMELELRRTEGHKFVAFSSEYGENIIVKQGVDKVSSDYAWYKRRPNPEIPLGRKRED